MQMHNSVELFLNYYFTQYCHGGNLTLAIADALSVAHWEDINR